MITIKPKEAIRISCDGEILSLTKASQGWLVVVKNKQGKQSRITRLIVEYWKEPSK